jgi:CheY-like chemotaxis protein
MASLSPARKDLALTSAKSASALRILVIEDDPICQRVVQLMLQYMGHEVMLVDNGKDALEVYRYYDLIISDLGLPDIDGVTICHTIRSHAAHHLMPIIALTANYQSETTCLSTGFTDFIAKPVEFKTLEQVINKNSSFLCAELIV